MTIFEGIQRINAISSTHGVVDTIKAPSNPLTAGLLIISFTKCLDLKRAFVCLRLAALKIGAKPQITKVVPKSYPI